MAPMSALRENSSVLPLRLLIFNGILTLNFFFKFMQVDFVTAIQVSHDVVDAYVYRQPYFFLIYDWLQCYEEKSNLRNRNSSCIQRRNIT